MTELSQLFDLYLDGELNENQADQLAKALNASDETRKQFVQHSFQYRLLHDAFAAEASTRLFDLADMEPASASRLQRFWLTAYSVVSNYIALSVLISALTMTVILLSMALITPEWKPFVPDGEPREIAVIAEITDTHTATWDKSSDGNFKNRELLTGDKLVLNSGLAEVTYETGAIVVMEGPCEFIVGAGEGKVSEVRGQSSGILSNGGFLKLGRLVASCDTQAAKGFTIDTVSGRVEDLGTEFGMEAPGGGGIDVHVFRGSVRLTPGGANGQRSESLVLGANEAASLDASGREIQRFVARRSDFRSALPEEAPVSELPEQVFQSFAGPFTVRDEVPRILVDTTNDTGDWIDRYQDAEDEGTLYYSFEVTIDDNAGETGSGGLYTALQLYQDDLERLGVGNFWMSVHWSAFRFGGARNLNPLTPIRSGSSAAIMVRIDFVANGHDKATIWFNPVDGGERDQPAGITTVLRGDSAQFNRVVVRAGKESAQATYRNIVFGTTFDAVARGNTASEKSEQE